MNEPEKCPRFNTCNASVCPLDPVPTVHIGGEAVCYYLINSQKQGAAELFQDDPVFEECVSQLPILAKRHPDIGRKVERASKTGMRGNNLRSERHQKPDSVVPNRGNQLHAMNMSS